MCSESFRTAAVLAAVVMSTVSCGLRDRISAISGGDVMAEISVPETMKGKDMSESADSLAGNVCDVGYSGIMKAVRDEVSGEMVASDVIEASKVVARFRNVAERNGIVKLGFDIIVPPEMVSSEWRLGFFPLMDVMGERIALEPVYVTGQGYRDMQMRGYMRYRAFLDSIVADSSAFIRKEVLEMFIRRYFPETYRMKNDTSYVTGDDAMNLFGVSVRDAVLHYTRHGMVRRNEKRKANREMMFRKYVKDPVVGTGTRLDTVVGLSSGSIVYRYVQEVNWRPGMKRIGVTMDGCLYLDGKEVCRLKKPDDLTYYISSLSDLADRTPRFVTEIVERKVYGSFDVQIEFRKGSAEVDLSLSDNEGQIRSLEDGIGRLLQRGDLVADSVCVTASCSPEGPVALNSSLAGRRAMALSDHIRPLLDGNCGIRTYTVPCNWQLFRKLVSSDTILTPLQRRQFLSAAEKASGGYSEEILHKLSGYGHVMESIYPKMRYVSFRFHMHRKGMQKDTVHTARPDTLYMAGVEAIGMMDYQKAVTILAPYRDYNTALALALAGYDAAALECLENLGRASPEADYLKAVLYSRAGQYERAAGCYSRSVEGRPSFQHRANLDPEIYEMLKNKDT